MIDNTALDNTATDTAGGNERLHTYCIESSQQPDLQ